MGRPKSGKNRSWSQEEKLRIIKRYLDEGIGQRSLAKDEEILPEMLSNWVKSYQK